MSLPELSDDRDRQSWIAKVLRLQLEVPDRLDELVSILRDSPEGEVDERLAAAFDCDLQQAQLMRRFPLDLFSQQRRRMTLQQLADMDAPPAG